MVDDLSPDDILAFWFQEAGPEKWYTKDDAFDALIKDRYEDLLKKVAADVESDGVYMWEHDPKGALATVITLDQFPRNMYRDRAAAFQYDGLALETAKRAVENGLDVEMPDGPRGFFYLPFMHSEDLADQDLCIQLIKGRTQNEESLRFAILHRDIIHRFGRFPHRNALLGRSSTDEEEQFLAEGGFAG